MAATGGSASVGKKFHLVGKVLTGPVVVAVGAAVLIFALLAIADRTVLSAVLLVALVAFMSVALG
jgi:hypothetical protein